MEPSEKFADRASATLTPIERRLAEIWRAALRVEAIGADDNFFSLGGDSVMMMLILSRVREEFGVELDQGLLFQFPTLRQLGELIANAGSQSASGVQPDGAVSGVI
ncbi:MAG: phosphopantetheine-binding protein [Steroidobacteraceae bacterium]